MLLLRISLIKVLKPYYPFPIIVDDAFVHFDKHRKERMLNYLRDLSKIIKCFISLALKII